MQQLLEDMVRRQAAFNRNVAGDWLERGFNWRRAVWTEAAELIGHLGWKWWSVDPCDLWQAQLEAVDIVAFTASWVLDEANGNIELAAKRLSHGLGKPAVENPSAHACCELFAASVLATERPSLPQLRALLESLDLTIGGLYARYIGKMVLNRFRQDNGYKVGDYVKVWAGLEDNAYLQQVVESLPEGGEDLDHLIYARLDNLYRRLVINAPEQEVAA